MRDVLASLLGRYHAVHLYIQSMGGTHGNAVPGVKVGTSQDGVPVQISKMYSMCFIGEIAYSCFTLFLKRKYNLLCFNAQIQLQPIEPMGKRDMQYHQSPK